MHDHTRRAAHSFILTACVLSLALSLAGFSRPPSKPAQPSLPFEMSVREIGVDPVLPGERPSAAPAESKSTLSHFGRIEPPLGGRGGSGSNPVVTVYTDSLRFRSESPFPFVAALSRDTIRVSSEENKPAAQMGGIESDQEMLRCLFEGPSLAIRFSSEYPGALNIEHLKSDCPGGLYRRLNLPVTMGPFVFAIPDGHDGKESGWQSIVVCPSFSGLGVFPQIRLKYAMKKKAATGEERTIEIQCDTTLTGVRATMPNGETVDIIADRIEVRGTLKPWPGLDRFYEGKIEIREEVRYVRPALDLGVLEKKCRAVITLTPR